MTKVKGIYQRKDGRWEARYKKGIDENGKTLYGAVYGKSSEEVEEKRRQLVGDETEQRVPTELNLLILGAGSHGRDVMEIAESLRIFNKIRFLDDHVQGEYIIGKCKDAMKFRGEYPCAFIAIGDNEKRRKYAKFLKERNFLIPKLISPLAIVSPNADIGEGTVVHPQGTVGEAKIGKHCIIASNSTISSEVVMGDYSRADSGSIVPKGMKVPEGTLLEIGEIFGM